MVKPIALCLEREASDSLEKYVRCTARPGRQAGLAIGFDGAILWCDSRACACELWVSNDQRLVAMRPLGGPPIRLLRIGRNLELPEGRAVVVLNGDELDFGVFKFRVHVHGTVDTIEPPRPLRVARGVAVAAAMSLSLGCATGTTLPTLGSAGATSSSSGGTSSSGQSTFDVAESTGGAPADAGGDAGQPIEVVVSPPN
jgi:hypothetical protein